MQRGEIWCYYLIYPKSHTTLGATHKQSLYVRHTLKAKEFSRRFLNPDYISSLYHQGYQSFWSNANFYYTLLQLEGRVFRFAKNFFLYLIVQGVH